MCSLSFVCFVYFYIHWHARTYSPQRGKFPLRAGIFFPNREFEAKAVKSTTIEETERSSAGKVSVVEFAD